ncbi:MAG: hypothetical protein AAF770_03730 [Bacteroidota bacterium]
MPTPYRKIKYLDHKKQYTNVHPLSRLYCCLVGSTLHFHSYDDKSTLIEQCLSPFEGNILPSKGISEQLIIATDAPRMVLFASTKRRIAREFKSINYKRE